jgi:hypothetical protein
MEVKRRLNKQTDNDHQLLLWLNKRSPPERMANPWAIKIVIEARKQFE